MKALILIIISFNLFAFKSTTPAKARLMGDAFSSLATGPFAVLYNPALLGRHSGFSFYPINTTLVIPNALAKADDFNNLSSDPQEIFDLVSDFPLRVGYNFSPGFQLGGFALTAIVDNDATIKIQNQVNPVLDLNYRDDRGFIMGYGYKIAQNLNFGASLKYIKRESIDQNFALTSTTILDVLDGGDLNQILNSLGRVKSQGFSMDFGLDYINQTGSTTFMSGLVVKDLYNTIEPDEGYEDLNPIEQKMSVNLSSAVRLNLAGAFGLTLSTELKNLEDTRRSFLNRLHFGGELSFTPALSLLAGYNDHALSYGGRLNLSLVDFYVGIVEEQQGKRIDQGNSSGIVLYLSLLDFKFEP